MEHDSEFLYGDKGGDAGKVSEVQVNKAFGDGSFEKLMRLRDDMDGVKEAMRDKVTKEAGFTWRQTEGEVEVTVPGAPPRKGVKVACTATTLRVSHPQGTLLEGRLHGGVISDDVLWCYEDADLVITLEKQLKGVAWPSIFAA
eukprot:TRINITY_DN47390_c0_g1_i1.p1 TRINITY_DN47390_c0_g1~~TRINITY_DN47390_c0_g1_i1.p1  ORF type:complete len:143 (+),score=42.62 TRINITY_DN47390_c0_g1_i1:31-459(+)